MDKQKVCVCVCVCVFVCVCVCVRARMDACARLCCVLKEVEFPHIFFFLAHV